MCLHMTCLYTTQMSKKHWERERKDFICVQGVHRIKLLLCVRYVQMQKLILISVTLSLLHELIYQLPGYFPSYIMYLFDLFHLARPCTSLPCSDGSLLIYASLVRLIEHEADQSILNKVFCHVSSFTTVIEWSWTAV